MNFTTVYWDLEDDPEGNVQHCLEHDVTMEEVEDVLQRPESHDVSESSGMPVVFGTTTTGRYLIVVYELIDSSTVYPITAYDVPSQR